MGASCEIMQIMIRDDAIPSLALVVLVLKINKMT